MGKITELAAKMKNKTARDYWTRADAHCEVDKWFAVQLNTGEFEEWSQYFMHLNWCPRHWPDLIRGDIQTFLVPAQWPSWFDSSFTAARPHQQAAE